MVFSRTVLLSCRSGDMTLEVTGIRISSYGPSGNMPSPKIKSGYSLSLILMTVMSAGFVLPGWCQVDGMMVGTWKSATQTPQGMLEMVWDIRPDGSYSLQSPGMSETGTLHCRSGAWSLKATSGRADHGRMKLSGNEMVVSSGKQSVSWYRLSGTAQPSQPDPQYQQSATPAYTTPQVVPNQNHPAYDFIDKMDTYDNHGQAQTIYQQSRDPRRERYQQRPRVDPMAAQEESDARRLGLSYVPADGDRNARTEFVLALNQARQRERSAQRYQSMADSSARQAAALIQQASNANTPRERAYLLTTAAQLLEQGGGGSGTAGEESRSLYLQAAAAMRSSPREGGAETYFRKARDLDPTNGDWPFLIAQLTWEQNPDAATVFLKEALAADRSSPGVQEEAQRLLANITGRHSGYQRPGEYHPPVTHTPEPYHAVAKPHHHQTQKPARPKHDPKPEPKREPKPEPKPEHKPEPKPDKPPERDAPQRRE